MSPTRRSLLKAVFVATLPVIPLGTPATVSSSSMQMVASGSVETLGRPAREVNCLFTIENGAFFYCHIITGDRYLIQNNNESLTPSEFADRLCAASAAACKKGYPA